MSIPLKTRLNASLRKAILANAIETAGLNEKQRQLIDRRAALYQDVVSAELARVGETQNSLRLKYNALRGDGVDSFIYMQIATSSALPGSHSALSVNLCGLRVYLYANGAERGGIKTHITEETHPHLAPIDKGGDFVPYSGVTVESPCLRATFEDIKVQQDAVDAKEIELTNTVNAVLRSASTVGKLLEVWPDAAALLPKELQAKDAGTGLALTVETLNALCGLPK